MIFKKYLEMEGFNKSKSKDLDDFINKLTKADVMNYAEEMKKRDIVENVRLNGVISKLEEDLSVRGVSTVRELCDSQHSLTFTKTDKGYSVIFSNGEKIEGTYMVDIFKRLEDL